MSLTTYACEIVTNDRGAKAQLEAEQERAAQRIHEGWQTGGKPRPRAIRFVTWLRGVEPHAGHTHDASAQVV